MEQEQAIKARLSSLRELRRLFRALRAMAAGRLHEALGALAGIRAYSDIVAAALSDTLAFDDPGGNVGQTGTGTDVPAIFLVGAEHGFVGGFNARLAERAQTLLAPGDRLFVVGTRAAIVATEAGLVPTDSFPAPTHVEGVRVVAREVFAALGTTARVQVIYGAYGRGGAFRVADRTILPVSAAPAAVVTPVPRDRSPLRPAPAAPLIQIPLPDLRAKLADEYLFSEIMAALTESLASEHAARLRVMEAADQSIADKLEVLGRLENDVRQETITAELLDVVTGTEAVMRTEGKW